MGMVDRGQKWERLMETGRGRIKDAERGKCGEDWKGVGEGCRNRNG
jgi:hypothetical protein